VPTHFLLAVAQAFLASQYKPTGDRHRGAQQQQNQAGIFEFQFYYRSLLWGVLDFFHGLGSGGVSARDSVQVALPRGTLERGLSGREGGREGGREREREREREEEE
jgi:hypothetical protein